MGTFLSFLLSMWGVMTLMLGFVAFFLFPIIGLATPFKGFSRVFLKLAALPLKRAAVVVSEQNDVTFKQMQFTNLGLEKIKLDGDEKLSEDPDSSLHYWLGIPFGLVDEEHGVIFDPRHAALGMRKRAIDKRGEAEYLATDEEYEAYRIAKWVPGTFKMPSVHEIVDLSAVQELIDGGERAEYPERGETFYKHSRDPFAEKASITKYLYPIIGFSVPFFGIWIGVTQLGGVGVDDTVSFGALLAFVASLSGLVDDPKATLKKGKDWLIGLNWPKIIAAFLLLSIPAAILGLIAWAVSVAIALAFAIVFGMGLSIVPLITVLASASIIIGGALSKLFFKLGFMGFRKPVFVWTREKYVIEEYDQLSAAAQHETTWYDLFGAVVGFSYRPGEESWGPEYMAHAEIESRQPVTDGGHNQGKESNLPKKFTQSYMSRDGYYGGYLPRRVSDRHYYLHSGIALSRFTGSATGNKTLRKLTEAKDEYGGADDGVEDGLVFKATLVSGLFGALLGTGIFLIPPLL